VDYFGTANNMTNALAESVVNVLNGANSEILRIR
jgi:hypothetical protein